MSDSRPGLFAMLLVGSFFYGAMTPVIEYARRASLISTAVSEAVSESTCLELPEGYWITRWASRSYMHGCIFIQSLLAALAPSAFAPQDQPMPPPQTHLYVWSVYYIIPAGLYTPLWAASIISDMTYWTSWEVWMVINYCLTRGTCFFMCSVVFEVHKGAIDHEDDKFSCINLMAVYISVASSCIFVCFLLDEAWAVYAMGCLDWMLHLVVLSLRHLIWRSRPSDCFVAIAARRMIVYRTVKAAFDVAKICCVIHLFERFPLGARSKTQSTMIVIMIVIAALTAALEVLVKVLMLSISTFGCRGDSGSAMAPSSLAPDVVGRPSQPDSERPLARSPKAQHIVFQHARET